MNKPYHLKKKMLLILMQISLACFAQQRTAIEIIAKMTEMNKSSKYTGYNTKYILFKNYTSQKPYEEYSGLMLKDNGANYVKIKNTEFVTFEDYNLKINHDQRAVIIGKSNVTAGETAPFSIESLTKGFSSKLISDNGSQYVCELYPPKISQIMLYKAIFYINKSDFSLVKQVLYLVENNEFKNKNGKLEYSAPRLEITYTKRPKNIERDKVFMQKSSYYTLKNGQIQLSKRIIKYRLFKS